MMTVAELAPASIVRDAGVPPLRRRSAAWLGLTPFALYVLLFLAVPALVAIGSGFFDRAGAFTFGNLASLGNPHIVNNFFNSFWLSALTAILGAILGAIVCFALLSAKPEGALRSVVDSASSVLAQFGGLMLAFAFIATIGIQGALAQALVAVGVVNNPFSNGVLYSVPGLVIPYLYFQIPLMVLTFMPAMEGLKATWGEANATLGGTRFVYWTRIAFPILSPAFFGSVILLFANSFSSYATAAALIDQGGIVPLAIKQQSSSETIVGVANVAGVLALGMVIIMVILMTAYSALQRRASRWQR